MISIRSRLIKFFLVKHMMRKAFDPFGVSASDLRLKATGMAKRIRIPDDALIEQLNMGGVHAEWIRERKAGEKSEKVVLYFHSGGFCLPYGNNHRDFSFRLSKISGVKVLAVDYRLAPEHKYPAPNEDCLQSYLWLLNNGYKSENIVLGGDSAGAGLALMTLLSLREKGVPLPKASFFLSIMGGDLRDFDGDSYESRKNRDPLNTAQVIKQYGEFYLGAQVLEPPIKQNLSGLPPMMIQVGDDEVLLSDSMLLAQKAGEAGVPVILQVWQGMWHVFQGFSMLMPEAKKAVADLGEFIHNNLRETESQVA